jgi:hypothetical protein
MKAIKTLMEKGKMTKTNGEGDAIEDGEACCQDYFKGF